MLVANSRPAHGYYIVGSWTQWEDVEEMDRREDGSYSSLVTLGVNRFESFQIWLDGDDDRILHPLEPGSGSGSTVAGPSEPIACSGLRWTIEGRSGPHPFALGHEAKGETEGSIVPGDGVLPYCVRDEGHPGDQYEVRLHIAGKYRAVSWHKVPRSSLAGPGTVSPSIMGKYYIAGAWTGWDFEEMQESSSKSGVYTFDVRLGFGSSEFVAVRNKDWEQVFCPASWSCASISGSKVMGPVDSSSQLAWNLAARSGDAFQIEFQRTFEDDAESLRISWNRVGGGASS